MRVCETCKRHEVWCGPLGNSGVQILYPLYGSLLKFLSFFFKFKTLCFLCYLFAQWVWNRSALNLLKTHTCQCFFVDGGDNKIGTCTIWNDPFCCPCTKMFNASSVEIQLRLNWRMVCGVWGHYPMLLWLICNPIMQSVNATTNYPSNYLILLTLTQRYK